MTRRHVWVFGLLSACAGSVTQDPPQDPGTMMDAATEDPPDASTEDPPDASTDAPEVIDAGNLVVGRACTADGDCGNAEYHCQPNAPGGYCSFMCTGDAECPSGSVCSPIPFSRITGICMKSCTQTNECRAGYVCAVVHLFPGQPNGPSSSTPVCWDDPDAGP